MKHTEFISFRMPLDLWQALETYCDRQEVTTSEAIRLAVARLVIKKTKWPHRKSPAKSEARSKSSNRKPWQVTDFYHLDPRKELDISNYKPKPSDSPNNLGRISKKISKLKRSTKPELDHFRAVWLLKADLLRLEQEIWERALTLSPSGARRDTRARDLLLARLRAIRESLLWPELASTGNLPDRSKSELSVLENPKN